MTTDRDRSVRRWLYVCAGAVVLAVIVGGITRLTESGLSITEWRPVSGILPPLTSGRVARRVSALPGNTRSADRAPRYHARSIPAVVRAGVGAPYDDADESLPVLKIRRPRSTSFVGAGPS
jgi:hypothetical protein